MAILAGMLALATVGLGRATTELLAAQRLVDKTQAFHAAEGGLDAELQYIGTLDPAAIDGLFRDPPAHPLDHCTVRVSDNGNATDGVIIVTSQVTAPSLPTPQRVKATIQVGGGGVPLAFKYAMAGNQINLDGHASIGTWLDPADLYIEESRTSGSQSMTAASGNVIYTKKMDFVNPLNLPLYAGCPTCLCPNCNNGGIFPFQPTDSFANLQAPKLPPIQIDLQPYYTEAIRQQSIDGKSYHHITATPAQPFNNETLEGVIYIECGVSVAFKGNVTVNGTIIHEGCAGNLKINSQGHLTIDSARPTATFGEPFEKGIAVLGQPDILWGNTTSIDITGYVMYAAMRSTISTTGTIVGGIIAINAPDNLQMKNDPNGPGSAGLVTWGPFGDANLGGTTNIIFKPLEQNRLQGQPSSQQKTKILLWRQE